MTKGRMFRKCKSLLKSSVGILFVASIIFGLFLFGKFIWNDIEDSRLVTVTVPNVTSSSECMGWYMAEAGGGGGAKYWDFKKDPDGGNCICQLHISIFEAKHAGLR